MSDIAIRVAELGKQYHIGKKQERYIALRDVLADAFVAPFRRAGKLLRGQATGAAELDEIIWALREVSFEIKQGEVVGIIGRNGAGKSTLLKILSRITEPTEGYAEVHGRVGSLLEVGTGFHPELTGRENIFLNGAILGMRKAEIERKFDEIVDFAEIEKFLDTPVKHYSSGMYLRLAFAVAAHLEPEILLVDEVLAVGDAQFQKKCLGKMQSVSKAGRTVLFVSHNLTAVEALCSKGMLLSSGGLKLFGDIQSVISAYVAEAFIQGIGLRARKDRKGNGKLLTSDVSVIGDGRLTRNIVRSGERTYLEIHYENRTNEEQKNVDVDIGIYDSLGRNISFLGNRPVGKYLVADTGGGVFRCVIDKLPLSPGKYFINVALVKNNEMLDWVQQAQGFIVEEGNFFGTGQRAEARIGGIFIEHTWTSVS